MKKFFTNLSYKFASFMVGRNGPDALSRAMSSLSIAFLLLSIFIRYLYPAAIVLLVLCYIRIFSKNIGARQKELYAYLRLKNKMSGKTAFIKRVWRERKTHRFFKCKSCKTNLRVPKGKGKIEIRCRVCGNKMIKRT